MDDALTSIESAVMVVRGAMIIVSSPIGIVRLYDQMLETGVMYGESRSLLTLVCVCRRLVRVRRVLLIPDSPCFLSIRAIDVLLGLGGPHALVEDSCEVKVEVKLQILWLLLQPRVFLLLPGPSFKDEGIEAEDAHHFLHIFCRMGRTQ